MKSKLLICTLALMLSLNIVGCGKKPSINQNSPSKEVLQQNKAQENNMLNLKELVDLTGLTEEELKNLSEEELNSLIQQFSQEEFVPGQFRDELKSSLNKLLPEISKKIKKILIENSNRIDEKFDMEKIQILLISNMNRNAYLINSQNEKYGKKDELVEYSTDTFKEKGILTIPYGLTKFNDKQTYVFNIDFFADGGNEKQMEDQIVKSIIHEGVHLILQKSLEGDVATAEESSSESRAETYPVLYEARIYRSQILSLYKKALQSEKKEDKIKYIKMGNYFYKKYFDMNEQHKNEGDVDKAEGQARYFEFRGLALLNNLDKDENAIKAETKRTFLDENYEMKEEAFAQTDKNGEFYSVGSIAYANIYDLGEEKELNYRNPLKYLLDKYGYTENEGNKELGTKVKEHYEEINNELKTTINGIDSKINDDKYAKIKIPVLYKYEENASVSYEGNQISYKFNGGNATIDKISREIRIGSNRILLKSATVVSTEGSSENEMMTYIYVMVPKDELEVENDKLTVQTKNIQIYNGKFIEENGMYKLVE